ncbi:hypothetical protein ACFX2J_040138 [Malus domestica]
MELEALCMAYDEIKKGENTQLHREVVQMISETNLEELQEIPNSANEKLVSLDLIYGILIQAFPCRTGIKNLNFSSGFPWK